MSGDAGQSIAQAWVTSSEETLLDRRDLTGGDTEIRHVPSPVVAQSSY